MHKHMCLVTHNHISEEEFPVKWEGLLLYYLEYTLYIHYFFLHGLHIHVCTSTNLKVELCKYII